MGTQVAAPSGKVASTIGPRLRWRVVAIGLLLLLLVTARFWAVTPFQVMSDSMSPTLAEGSTIFVDRVAIRWDDVDRQDLVLFSTPDGSVVKRVVGLPGDQVRIYDAVLQVNGTPVAEPYVDALTLDGVFFGPVRVPADHVFVLGDNRFDSIDSRHYGPIPIASIEGRVIGH